MVYTLSLRSDGSEKVPYTHPEYPLYLSHALLSRACEGRVPFHWHDDLEILTVLSGRMNYAVDGEVFSLTPGSGIFCGPRHIHANYAQEGEDCEYLCLVFPMEVICPGEEFRRRYFPAFTGADAPACFPLNPGDPREKAVMDSLIDLIAARDAEDPALGFRMMRQLYAIGEQLFLRLQDLPRVQPPSDSRFLALRDMVGYVQSHYAENLCLEDIAQAGGMGKSNCSLLFRRYLQQTPMGYLCHYRLEKAMDLLRSTDKSITEVALSAGFASQSYFAEVFHRAMGVTPSRYRRNSAKN